MGLFKSGFGKVAIVAGAVIGIKYGMQYLLPMLRAKNAGEKLVIVFQNIRLVLTFEKVIVRLDVLCKNPANTPLQFTYPFTQIFVEGKEFGSSEPKKDMITIPAFSQKVFPYSVEMKLLPALQKFGATLYQKIINKKGTVVKIDTLIYIEGTAPMTISTTKTILG
jgi:hypothetical protein